MEQEKYDSTVSSSKQESIRLAMELLEEDLKNERPTIVRPEISLPRMLLSFFLRLSPIPIVWFLTKLIPFNPWVRVLLIAVVATATILLNLRRGVVGAILIYQRYAPERIRASCVFQPTCSNYMLIAIEKYGLIRGVVKGVNRLARCHPPNSGEDNP